MDFPADATVAIVTADRLLDPKTGHILAPAAVSFEGGRISDVGRPELVATGARTDATIIDIGDATLLPGLIDGHAHLMLNVSIPAEGDQGRFGLFQPGLLLAVAGTTPTDRAFLGARLAAEDLESGFTCARNLGHSGVDGDAALRDAIDAGTVPGPRLLAAGRKLTAPGGYFSSLNPAVARPILKQEFLEVATPDQARRAVNLNLFYGADVIKVVADDAGMGITTPVMAAIVGEAHLAQKRVAVHASSQTAIQIAIDGGADSIEHGNAVSDDQLRMMRDAGAFLGVTPTFWNGFLGQAFEATIAVSPGLREDMAAGVLQRRPKDAAFVDRVLKSEVKFAAGSDMCWSYPGRTRGQATAMMFEALHSAGMPPGDILRAVTVDAAEMLGWQDTVGAIESGKYADLVAVAGNPMTDPTELSRVRFVMKGGQVIRNELARSGDGTRR